MLGLEWIPAFEIIKTHAMALKIGHTFCNNAVSAKTLCGLRILFSMFVWKTTFIFSQIFFLPQK